jgi:dTMP kinase
MNQERRLESLEEILEELSLLSRDHVIIVEGPRDREALEDLGIYGEMMAVQSEGGPLKVSETIYGAGKEAVILTDWDHKGETIADELKRNLSALCVHFDRNIRARLRDVCVKDIKDVESLPALYRRLSSMKEE